MKQKTSPIIKKSGNYLEQACLEGLSDVGRKFALSEIKKCKDMGCDELEIPYAIIKKAAIIWETKAPNPITNNSPLTKGVGGLS